MKYIIPFLFLFTCFSRMEASTIQWKTNYDEAVKDGKAKSKPIVLFFTGTDWCKWCNKLESEVFSTQEFSNEMQDQMIFVKLDFPMRTPLPPQLSEQNKRLQDQYGIKSFPTVVVIDGNERQIGLTGYRPGGGKQYAAHLKKIAGEYSAYIQKLGLLGKQPFSGKELKRVYQKACELQRDEDCHTIISYGIESDLSPYFLSEKFRRVVELEGKDSPRAIALKEKLLHHDPANKELSHYQVAVIEFEDCCQRGQAPDATVAPLVAYLNKFGNKDSQNAWRLHMIVSQVYSNHQKSKEALHHAEQAFQTAPDSHRKDISSVVESIKNRL